MPLAYVIHGSYFSFVPWLMLGLFLLMAPCVAAIPALLGIAVDFVNPKPGPTSGIRLSMQLGMVAYVLQPVGFFLIVAVAVKLWKTKRDENDAA